LVVKDLFYTILCDIVCQRIISVAQASININRLNFLVNLVVQMGAIKFLIVEKFVPNTFIMFVFLFTELNLVQIHTSTCFPGPDDC
jgi:hypothetical protein